MQAVVYSHVVLIIKLRNINKRTECKLLIFRSSSEKCVQLKKTDYSKERVYINNSIYEKNILKMLIMGVFNVVICFCVMYKSEIKYGNFHLLRIMNDLNI
jgi:hypothetical protein